jgi:hypothetical protein
MAERELMEEEHFQEKIQVRLIEVQLMQLDM